MSLCKQLEVDIFSTFQFGSSDIYSAIVVFMVIYKNQVVLRFVTPSSEIVF